MNADRSEDTSEERARPGAQGRGAAEGVSADRSEDTSEERARPGAQGRGAAEGVSADRSEDTSEERARPGAQGRGAAEGVSADRSEDTSEERARPGAQGRGAAEGVSTHPDMLPLDELGDGIGRAATVLRANAGAAGLDAAVPTCPGWTVLDLVVHQGMVHRWATAHVLGHPVDEAGTQALEREGRSHPDVLGWLDDGATALLQAIVDASDDLDALVFLKAAPAPKMFWTRRQCHETTIHAVDALAARLGRAPEPAETWIPERLALDGIDELLRGFAARRREGLHPEAETRLLVRPDGGGLAWLLELGPDHPVVATRLQSPETALTPGADHVLSGSAVDLYLRLWSRTGAQPANAGERWWRDHLSVTWA